MKRTIGILDLIIFLLSIIVLLIAFSMNMDKLSLLIGVGSVSYTHLDNVVCHYGVCRHSLRGLTAVIAYRGGIFKILRYSRCPHMVHEPKDL